MIEYKDITQLETLDELADGSYIMVVQDGTAKLISKENAKFGGGGITTFYAVENGVAEESASGGSPIAVQAVALPSYTVQHADGTEVTAQEAYDAYMAGGVRLSIPGDRPFFADVASMGWLDSNGEQLDPANVMYVAFTYNSMNGLYVIIDLGENPSIQQ